MSFGLTCIILLLSTVYWMSQLPFLMQIFLFLLHFSVQLWFAYFKRGSTKNGRDRNYRRNDDGAIGSHDWWRTTKSWGVFILCLINNSCCLLMVLLKTLWFMTSGSIAEKGVNAFVWDLPTPLSLQTLQTGSQDKVYTSLSCCASQHPSVNESSLHYLLLQDRLQITAASELVCCAVLLF